MTHQVLSRKYRPQQFSDLVGQDHVARIIENTLRSGRAGHAYLFVGPRGVGKTTMARLFARALNCSGRDLADGIEPCGTCPSCVDIAAGSDLDVVEMDAASNNHVEDVRTLREQVGYATVRSAHRIWIVDEVHMLSLAAFNAFLKTLEEPPEGVKFLFCTTEEHKLPDTFRSRCQRIEFRPISVEAMAERLSGLAAREDVRLEDGVAQQIAGGALGGLRDGESLLEQLIAACPGGVVSQADLDLLSGRAPSERLEALRTAIDAGDAVAALDAVDACIDSGCKPGVLFDQWLELLRGSLVEAARGGESERPRIARLSRAVDVLLGKRAHLRSGADGVLIAQVAAIELARLPDARDLDALVQALKGAGAGAAPSAAPSGAPRPREPQSPPARAERPPAAPAEEPAPARELDVERLTSGWEGFLAALARRDSRLGEAARTLEPEAVVDGVVHLRMREDVDGVRAMFARREIQIAFSQVAREAFGSALRARIDDAPEIVQDVGGDGPDLRSHPVVSMVTEHTKGRLINVERAEHPDDA